MHDIVVGAGVGNAVGAKVGAREGDDVGTLEGAPVGTTDEAFVGSCVGSSVGVGVGLESANPPSIPHSQASPVNGGIVTSVAGTADEEDEDSEGLSDESAGTDVGTRAHL
jgi:hypothetical protein